VFIKVNLSFCLIDNLYSFYIDLIYVCGGFDGSARLSSTECYDEKTDVWTLGEDMHVGREGAGLVAIGDHLYCIGKYKTIKMGLVLFFSYY
jgi:hypothetical protein